jgi:tetratricopeptide (TPR) repeat protein
MRKMMQVYRTGNFELAYGRTLQQLVGEWEGFLDRMVVPDRDGDIVEVLFRRPPIFRKVCARVIAERNRLARRKYGEAKYAEAAALYRESFSEGGGYASLSGYLSSALRGGDVLDVATALDSIIMKDLHPLQYLPLLLTIGDANWVLGNTRKALDLYMHVSQSDLSVALDEALALRSHTLKEAGTDTSLRAYFISEESDTARLVRLESVLSRQPALWVARYLKGRLLLRMQQFGESLDILSSLDLASRDSLLEALRLRMAGHDLFRLRDFEMAKASFWSSLNYNSSEVAVHEVNDWIDRCEWMEKHELK